VRLIFEGGTDGEHKIGPGSAPAGVDQGHVGSTVMEIDQDSAPRQIPAQDGGGMFGANYVAFVRYIRNSSLAKTCCNQSSISIDRRSTAARQTSSQALTERRALSPVTGHSLPFVIAPCNSS